MARAFALLEAQVPEVPGRADLRGIMARVYERAGAMQVSTGRTAQSVRDAVGNFRKAREITRELHAEFPEDDRKRSNELESITNLARALALAGEYREADRTIREAVESSQGLVARDPTDAALAIERMGILVVAADIAGLLGENARAIRHGREALAHAARLPKETRKSRDVRARIAEAKVFTGYGLLASAGADSLERGERLAKLREARSLLADGVAFLGEMRTEKLGSVPEDVERKLTDALKRCNEAIARLAVA